MLEINTFNEQETAVLTLNGTIDGLSSGTLDRVLRQLLNSESTRIILDCKKVPYISSVGLKVLFRFCVDACSGKSVWIANPNSSLHSLIRLSGLYAWLGVIPSWGTPAKMTS